MGKEGSRKFKKLQEGLRSFKEVQRFQGVLDGTEKTLEGIRGI